MTGKNQLALQHPCMEASWPVLLPHQRSRQVPQSQGCPRHLCALPTEQLRVGLLPVRGEWEMSCQLSVWLEVLWKNSMEVLWSSAVLTPKTILTRCLNL